MKIFLAFIFILSPLFLTEILACQCHFLPSVWNSFDSSDAVFVGKAVNSNLKDENSFLAYQNGSQEDMIFEFEVQKSFKGINTKLVKINLGEPNMCEGGFQIGESYLIYAFGNSERNLETSTFCSRIEKLEDAQDQIYFINEKINKKLEPQFYGSVKLEFKENETWNTKFLTNYKFFIEKDKKKIEIITDQNGNFKISNLKKGIYKTFVSERSDYKPYLIEIERFRVLESGRAIPNAGENPFGVNDKEFEKLIQEPPEIFGMLKNYSKGVYLEITLK